MTFALVLAGCSDIRPVPAGAYRDPAAPIYSSAVLDAARLEGRWQQVAGFAAEPGGDCQAGAVEFTEARDGLRAALRLCLSGVESRASSDLVAVGPGRFALAGAAVPGIGEPWWVLWADTDYRTLVVGTPSGRFGFILNRGGRLPADRLVAAKEILDWNGYEVDFLDVF